MDKKILGFVIIGVLLLVSLIGCVGCSGGNKADIGRCVKCGNPTSLKQGGYFVCSSCKKKGLNHTIYEDKKYIVELTHL